MTEFEIASLAIMKAEAARHQIEIMLGISETVEIRFTSFTTLLFGYLVVANFGGRSLSRVQAGIFTGLYIAVISQFVYTYFVAGMAAATAAGSLIELRPELEFGGIDLLLIRFQFAVAVQVLCVLASLYFMWSIRHTKTE